MIASIQGSAKSSFSSPLSQIVSLLPTAGKLTIIPIKDVGGALPIPLSASVYTAMFNPENFTIASSINYEDEQEPGSATKELKFVKMPPREFTFDLVIDGTGASGEKREVFADINHIKATTGFFGDLHQPPPLLLVWGTFIAKCRLTNFTTNYTLFRDNGTPLRAKVSLSFKEYASKEEGFRLMNLASPDLTHERAVVAGDKLPLLCYKQYEDSRHYLEIAKVNGLVNFRSLRAGKKLVFPPIEKK